MKFFIKPPLDAYPPVESNYYKEYKTYAEYNYLRPGISSRVKAWHFETALKLTYQHFHKSNVIDFGCADGVFLPSLSKYFNHVVAIDKDPDFIKTATHLVNRQGIHNVELICNDNLTIYDLRLRTSSHKCHILYLLEVLEHVGDKESLYESKMDFLKEIATLIDNDGIIVISVPKMVGVSFLIQRVGLTLLGLRRESISMANLLKASFLSDTSDLERQWQGDHLGFNHKRLEGYLKNDFRVLEKRSDIFRIIYIVGKHKPHLA